MAIIIKCANGHFYDADKSKDCPICAKYGENREVVFIDRSVPQPVFQDSQIGDDVTVAKLSDQSIFISGKEGPVQGISSDGDVTIGMFQKATGRAFITGWLVGTSGPVKGRDYRIYHGINWVGNSYRADIIIPEDIYIEPNKHCGLVYDGANVDFYLIPGQGTNTYLNGELLTSQKKIYPYDEIFMGKSTFEFIPYCKEGHVWNSDPDDGISS